MIHNRRKFLGLFGASAAAAPLVAKQAADTAFAELTSIRGALNGLGDSSMGMQVPCGEPAQCTSSEYVPYEQRLINAADHVRIFGLPKHVDAAFRDQARYVPNLDPDIACKKSWSMSVKIMTQQERNYQRLISRISETGWQQRGRMSLKKILGFDFPW